MPKRLFSFAAGSVSYILSIKSHIWAEKALKQRPAGLLGLSAAIYKAVLWGCALQAMSLYVIWPPAPGGGGRAALRRSAVLRLMRNLYRGKAPVRKMPVYSQPDKPVIGEERQGGALKLDLSGRWDTVTVFMVDDAMERLGSASDKSVIIGIGDISRLDTAGAWLIVRLYRQLEARKVAVRYDGAKESWLNLFKIVGKTLDDAEKDVQPKKDSWPVRVAGGLGRTVINGFSDFRSAMFILGSMILGAQLKKRRTFSLPALVNQMDKMGVGAIPIIVLMSFIVGAIIAQQGAFQLRQFGAEIFVVDLLGILVFRELGVLLTAIMIAGRSGSAITAEIGSMRMREETDALQVMGLNPISVLVFPRLVALAIVLPLLTVIADISALVGGGLVAYFYSNISVSAYIGRLLDTVQLTTYFAGLIKAPFMAFIIGIIAAVEGLKVGGSAESLGASVTSSVVKSIFLVIIVDGFFAMFYAAINF